MNKRLLFITHHRLCDNNGGSNASKGFLYSFATLFDDCSIICPSFEGDTVPFIPSNVKIHFIDNHRSNLHKFFDMYRGIISPIYYAVKDHLQTNKYDIIVIDHSFSGAGITRMCKATGAKIITIHHNVERDYLRDNSKERPIFYRYPFLYYSRKAEKGCLKDSDINLTVTERDASVFRSWYPNICVYPWGIFEYRRMQDKVFTPKQRQRTFIITGSLYFAQSLMPIMDFVDKYWHLVRKHYPDATLLIAGRNPSAELESKCAASEGITIIPNPEDMAEVVQRADYYICPIYAGSGLKLRIYDGLKQGLPVLCHEVSASGYENLIANHCMFPYKDEATFMKSLHTLLSSTISQEEVYNTYRKTFSLSAGVKVLNEILEKERL